MSIKVENLSHVFDKGTVMETYAFKDVSFEIKDGSFTGVIGHTGSGKSTLIQHLNGLLKPDSGTVYYNGEDIFAEKYNMKALRGQVGLVFQYPEYQLFEENVLKDVMFGPLNMGASEAEAREKALNAIRMTGLSDDICGRNPFDLSGGQKRRAAIAGVLAMEPRVLILDEPTAGLDPKGRDEILDTVAELNKKKLITIILVSHSMEDIARYADMLLVMNKGALQYYDTPKNVFAHAAELEKMGLSVPEVTKIAGDLKEAGIDIDTSVSTVEEAKREILRIWRKK